MTRFILWAILAPKSGNVYPTAIGSGFPTPNQP
jgi:hypothetical protein